MLNDSYNNYKDKLKELYGEEAQVGWSIDTGIYWIDFNHSKVTLDDGLEVLVIDMDWVPDAGWDSE